MLNWKRLDGSIILLWAALVGVGLLAIYSYTNGPASEFMLDSVKQNFYRQLMWAGICLMGLLIALLLPVRFYQNAAFPIYVLTMLLLVGALVLGREVNGAKSWLVIGPLRLQSSELAKVGTILAVARLFANQRFTAPTLRYAFYTVALILFPTAIIILQNDMGTALVFLSMIPIMLFWSGLPMHYVLLMIMPAVVGYLGVVYLPAAIGVALIFTIAMFIQARERIVGWLAGLFSAGAATAAYLILNVLPQNYQIQRLISFTNPGSAEFRSGVGFHLVQSKAAIGSGGLVGKGFMQGTQTQGSYVPEASTDFIFSVIGEEFGLIGGLIVLVLFAMLLVRLTLLGTQIKHPFGVMVAAGAVGVFLVHIFINLGMATGIMPVIGIPLPFVSYGGSALMANTALLAVALTLHLRRDDFSIYGY